jgi:hypothetical protein
MFWWSVAPTYGKIRDGLDTNMKSPFWFLPTGNGWGTANLLVLVGKSPDSNHPKIPLVLRPLCSKSSGFKVAQSP